MMFTGFFGGLITIDIQYLTDKYPEPNTKVKTLPPEILVGGPATNAAVAFSWLNGSANLASVNGVHLFSEYIINDLNTHKVRFIDLCPGEAGNPVLASIITTRENGDRTIVTHNPEPIRLSVSGKDIFRETSPQILMLDGFYPEAFNEWAKEAKANSIPVVLDCGSWKTQYEELLPLADVAICSADFLPPGCLTVDEVIKYLEGHGVKHIAVSRGNQTLIFKESTVRGEVEVKKVQVKDTLGAGDFLHGAFCYYYLETGFAFRESLEKAVNFATFTCLFDGTRSWINNPETYNRFMK